jgi:outer membrane protein assembly factor BamB
MLARLQGTLQVLVFDAVGLTAYRPNDGASLWHYPWVTDYDVNAGQPLVLDDERVFLSSGYGRGCAMLRVTEANSAWQVEKLWEHRSMQLKFSSALLHEGFLYGLDNNILVCLDPETGGRRWKAGRYGYGQLVLADGYLIIQCENGDLALVEASPEEHREISRVDALTAKTWNHPALADGKLLLRNDREMLCFDLAPDSAYHDH